MLLAATAVSACVVVSGEKDPGRLGHQHTHTARAHDACFSSSWGVAGGGQGVRPSARMSLRVGDTQGTTAAPAADAAAAAAVLKIQRFGTIQLV